MLKTGFIGYPSGIVSEAISKHHGFELTGILKQDRDFPVINHVAGAPVQVPSFQELVSKSDVLIIQQPGPGLADIITHALRHSRHIMLMETGGVSMFSIKKIIELQREAHTVVKICRPDRINPSLKAVIPRVTHPSLFEIKLLFPRHLARLSSCSEALTWNLLKMLDVLLFLCPANIQKIRSFRHLNGTSPSGLINAGIEFDNGSVANILCSDVTKKKVFSIFIYRTNLFIEVDLTRPGYFIVDNSANTDTINSSSREFEFIAEKSFFNELDSFHQLITNNNHTGKDLFELSKLIELSHNITGKSYLPEPA